MKDLAGRLAFITGGASGIGLAIASAFGREGVKLVELRFEEIRAAMAAAPAATPPDDLAYLGKGGLALAKR